jgi:hypothetical protein
MLNEPLWKEAGLGPGRAHWLCVEACLGRELGLADLKDVLGNESIRLGWMLAGRVNGRQEG